MLLWQSQAFAQSTGPTIVDFRRDGPSLLVDVTLEAPPGADWVSEQLFDEPAHIARMTDGMVSFGIGFAELTVQDLRKTEADATVELAFTLSLTIPPEAEVVTFRWPLAFGAVVLRQHGVPEAFGGYFAQGQFPDAIPLAGGAARSSQDIAVQNFVTGIETVWPRGVEFIFLAALIFLKRGWPGPMIAQLAAMGFGNACAVVALSFVTWSPTPALVAWALPVVVVMLALDNIVMRGLRVWRLALLFLFAGLHSFGFAATMGGANIAAMQVLPATAGYGLGILVAISGAVLVGYLTLAIWFGHSLKYRGRVIMPASLTVLGWELYRLFG
ncbi:HupE/UreJ family protein [Epibacterium ulvae]|uniref:HupE/UreJ family protein n=1 Tax=Epibacterium ulvae TaxID=1156985 RepID=UPI001BFC7014|nr:HupE/UreJ family protein [Epibacterium ulvae]MBT8154414.1 HupE/UreJ family protein [Epibacterium ulvae]